MNAFCVEDTKIKIDIIFVKHILLCKMVLLDLSNENLTKIPIIPNDVTELHLQYNQITKIENLSNSIQILYQFIFVFCDIKYKLNGI